MGLLGPHNNFDVNNSQYLIYLQNGDFMTFITSVYTNLLDIWAYVYILFVTLGMLYLKGQGAETPTILGFFLVAAFGLMFPAELGFIILFLLSLGLVSILYPIFVHRED